MIIINKSHLKVVKIHKSVVIHLKLTATQKSFVNWILGCKRLVWNDALEYKQYLWETYKRRNPCIDNLEELAHIYDLESNTNIQKAFAQSRVIEYPGYEFLSKCPARCITQVLNDLNLTFSSFLNKKSGYPRFKRKKDPVQSIRFDDQLHIKKLNKKNIYVRRGKLFKFKGVNPAITNEDIFLKKMKNITIKKDNLNSYYAILNYDAELKIEESVNKDKIVAIDVGITDGVVTSSNQRFNLPKNKMQGLVERRKKKQIQLKTKQKGSLAYIKKLNQIRKIYKKEANIRKEYNHQISKELANKHGLIIREDLKIEFMLKSLKGTKDNPGKNVKLKTKLNNKASNQGWGQLFRFIEHKFAGCGGTVIKINPKYTSQKCSSCGEIDAKSRRGKKFKCTTCHFEMDADLNAAINIRTCGLREMAERETSALISIKMRTKKLKTSEFEKPTSK